MEFIFAVIIRIKMKYTDVIWDWNGTLLNDVALGVEVMNELLLEYSLPSITIAHYQKIFRFPVIDYYKDLGFPSERDAFETIGMRFINRYNERQFESKLRPYTMEVLNALHTSGVRQWVLSAREQIQLELGLAHFSLSNYFEAIYGLNNHMADGKSSLATLLKAQMPQDTKVCMIGDTSHDAALALQMGWDCILLRGGHEDDLRLDTNPYPKAQNMEELINLTHG